MKVSTVALLAVTLLGAIVFNPTRASAAELDIHLSNQQSNIAVGIGNNHPNYLAVLPSEQQHRLEAQRLAEQRARESQQRLAAQRVREQQQRLAEQRAREAQQRLAAQRVREQQQRLAEQRAREAQQRLAEQRTREQQRLAYQNHR
jgi:hypothetical protein